MIDKKEILRKAVSKIRGERLYKLYLICDKQKTITTSKLNRLVEELHESDKKDAAYLRYLYDNIKMDD